MIEKQMVIEVKFIQGEEKEKKKEKRMVEKQMTIESSLYRIKIKLNIL